MGFLATYWTDLVAIVLVLLFAIIGFRSGALKMGFRVASIFAAILLAKFLYPVISGFLCGTPLYDGLLQSITEKIASGKFGQMMNWIPEFLSHGGNDAINTVSVYMTRFLLNGIAFLVVFLVIKILLMTAGKLLDLFSKLPVLGIINRLAGLVLGILEGGLILCIILAAIALINPLRENSAVQQSMEQSAIVQTVYENNPLVTWILPMEQETPNLPPQQNL